MYTFNLHLDESKLTHVTTTQKPPWALATLPASLPPQPYYEFCHCSLICLLFVSVDLY